MRKKIQHWRGHALYPYTPNDLPQDTLSEGELYMCMDSKDPALVFKDESGKFVIIRPTGRGSDLQDNPNGTIIDKGNRTVNELNRSIDNKIGVMYNVTDNGILNKTIEGHPMPVYAGDNVMWTENGWDIISGTNCPSLKFKGTSTENVGRISSGMKLDGLSAIDILQLMLKGHTQIAIADISSSDLLKVDQKSTLHMQVITKNCINGDGVPQVTVKLEGKMASGLSPYEINQSFITGSGTTWSVTDTIEAGLTKNSKDIEYSFVAISNCEDEQSEPMTFKFTPYYPVIMLNSINDTIANNEVDLTTLQSGVIETDDAATAILGKEWRMPTQDEWQELIDNTEIVTLDSSFQLTSKINGKSIILPFVDFGEYYSTAYWSSNLYDGRLSSYWAMGAYFESDKSDHFMTWCDVNSFERPIPLFIRPVSQTLGIDLGLPSGIKWSASNLTDTELADNILDIGQSFAWGETKPCKYSFLDFMNYDDYSFIYVTLTPIYKFFDSKFFLPKLDGSDEDDYNILFQSRYEFLHFSMSKYNSHDHLTSLSLPHPTNLSQPTQNDSAASIILGDNWRIPSEIDFAELLCYCKMEYIDNISDDGQRLTYLVLTSFINGNSITFPSHINDNTIYYQTSSLHRFRDYSFYPIPIFFNPDRPDINSQTYLLGYTTDVYNDAEHNNFNYYDFETNRCVGTYIRPISSTDGIDLGLPSGTRWAPTDLTATGLADSNKTPGDRFAFGETTPKEKYDLISYRFYDPIKKVFTKYTFDDGLIELEQPLDASITYPDEKEDEYHTSLFYTYMKSKPNTLSDSQKLEFFTQDGHYTYLLVPKIWNVGQINLLAGNAAEFSYMPCTDLNIPGTVAQDVQVILNDGKSYPYQYYRTAVKQKAFKYNFRF